MQNQMKLQITLLNGKRVQRTRKQTIIAQNDKRSDGTVITKFYDKWNFDNQCTPVPFLECKATSIKFFSGAISVVSTFAK